MEKCEMETQKEKNILTMKWMEMICKATHKRYAII